MTNPVRAAALAVALALVAAACSSSSGTTTTTAVGAKSVPVLAGPAALVAAGKQHSFGPGAAGKVLAWGTNGSGELGDGTVVRADVPIEVAAISGHGRIVQIDAGTAHSIAVTSDGSLYAWGHNTSGQLGDGTTNDTPTPKRIGSLTRVRAIAAGDSFSLALLADGSVWAWGNNQSGQLGDGKAPQDHNSPKMVFGLGPGSNVSAIAAGESFGLALKRDGSIVGWGNGTSGQLGNGTVLKQSAPTPVERITPSSGVIAIDAGNSYSMALSKDGTVWAWGNNQSGQLGDGTAPTDHHVPFKVKGFGKGSGIIAIAAGDTFAYALEKDGSAWAWGNNQSGQLGDDHAPKDQWVPVPVHGLGTGSGVVALAAGGSHGIFVLKSGRLVSVGNNSHGQLGDGKTPTDAHVPVAVSATH